MEPSQQRGVCQKCGLLCVGLCRPCDILVDVEPDEEDGAVASGNRLGATKGTDQHRSIAKPEQEMVRTFDRFAIADGRQDMSGQDDAQARQWLEEAYELALETDGSDRMEDLPKEPPNGTIGKEEPNSGEYVGFGLVLEFCMFCNRVLLEDCPHCEAVSEEFADLAAVANFGGDANDFPFQCTFYCEPGHAAHAHCTFAACIDANKSD